MKQIQKATNDKEWNIFIDGNQVMVEYNGNKRNVKLESAFSYANQCSEARSMLARMYEAKKIKKRQARYKRARIGAYHLDNDYKLVQSEDIDLPLAAKHIYQSKTWTEYLIVVSHDDRIYNLNIDAFEEIC